MFGYIKIHKSELKVKEYEQYKGLYCSLCKRLGKDYGFLGRMTLNYDFLFFLLCRMAINENDLCFESSHCSFNPRKKCFCCSRDEDELVYAAALSILFTYHKIKDDLYDSKFFKKIPLCFLLLLFNHKYIKAKARFPDIFGAIENELILQKDIERRSDASLDECADISAKVLGEAFSYKVKSDDKNNSYRFGYCIGRLVYIFDAVDDYEKDKKSNCFNPFLANKAKYVNITYDKMRQMLNISADEVARIYEKLRIKKFKSIIDNIIYFGFDDTINNIFEKKGV